MQFLKCSRIFSGEKGCFRIARVFESGMNFIESTHWTAPQFKWLA
jgi:hypothetical protein